MALDFEKIRVSIEKGLKETADGENRNYEDIAFHMTDWLADLERYYEFCRNPEGLNSEEIEDLLMDFLVHVPNHVAAASALLLGIPVRDIFGVGAVDCDAEAT